MGYYLPMDTTSACPVCGSPTRRAFATTANYQTCIREGHVTPTTEASHG